jgi:hypothetical protein
MEVLSMENVTYYKCAVCGSTYGSIANRAVCERACLKKKEEDERKAAEAKKAAEYEARVEEVNQAFEKAYELRDKLVEDYGEYHYQHSIGNLKLDTLSNVFESLFGI